MSTSVLQKQHNMIGDSLENHGDLSLDQNNGTFDTLHDTELPSLPVDDSLGNSADWGNISGCGFVGDMENVEEKSQGAEELGWIPPTLSSPQASERNIMSSLEPMPLAPLMPEKFRALSISDIHDDDATKPVVTEHRQITRVVSDDSENTVIAPTFKIGHNNMQQPFSPRVTAESPQMSSFPTSPNPVSPQDFSAALSKLAFRMKQSELTRRQIEQIKVPFERRHSLDMNVQNMRKKVMNAIQDDVNRVEEVTEASPGAPKRRHSMEMNIKCSQMLVKACNQETGTVENVPVTNEFPFPKLPENPEELDEFWRVKRRRNSNMF